MRTKSRKKTGNVERRREEGEEVRREEKAEKKTGKMARRREEGEERGINVRQQFEDDFAPVTHA